MSKKDEIKDVLSEYFSLGCDKKDYSMNASEITTKILDICNQEKNQESIKTATITLTTLLNGLIKGDFFLEDFPEATILKLKILLTGSLNSSKPRELSKEKIKRIANETSTEKPEYRQYPISYLNHLIDEGRDIWEDER